MLVYDKPMLVYDKLLLVCHRRTFRFAPAADRFFIQTANYKRVTL